MPYETPVETEESPLHHEAVVELPPVPTFHKWRQSGVRIYCSSCPQEHGFYVKSNVRLIGMDEAGQPVLR